MDMSPLLRVMDQMAIWSSFYVFFLCFWFQVEGQEALTKLRNKLKSRGASVLYHGSLAAAAATAVGHFPWFYTYNSLQAYLPKTEDPLKKLGRNALIGFLSSVVSDSVSNSLRVIKTTRQTFPETISYVDTVRHVVAKDGLLGLLGRGLKTRYVLTFNL